MLFVTCVKDIEFTKVLLDSIFESETQIRYTTNYFDNQLTSTGGIKQLNCKLGYKAFVKLFWNVILFLCSKTFTC